jgi:transposase
MRLHVFGAYHWRSDRVTYLTDRRKNGDTFIRFLEHLLAATGDKKIVLVMDNASYHPNRLMLSKNFQLVA